jgi:hypothetical protein
MLVLSFTRDATIVPLFGVAWIAATTQTRRSAAVLGTGVASAVPALILFGAPVVQQLAWALSGFRHIPGHSWSYVEARYPRGILHLLHLDAIYPGALSFHLFWYAVGAIIIGSILYMLIASPSRDPFFILQRGALIGAAATVALSAAWTDMRVEIVFVPCVAAALAFAIRRLWTSVPVARLAGAAFAKEQLAPTDS